MIFETGEACAVYPNCANAGMQCWACTFPEDALAPTEYLPRDPKILHPETQSRLAARKLARKEKKQSEASKRGKASRRKGQRVERDFAKLTGGARVPLSGALRGTLSNDVNLPPELGGLSVEVKARRDGWKELRRWLEDEVEKPDAVVLKPDNGPWIVCQLYPQWAAGREASPVNLKKLAEAMKLLQEAIR